MLLDAWRQSDSILWNYSCPSVCLSICPSLSFLKNGSVAFFDILHADSWSWYLVTEEARHDMNLGSMGLNQAQNEVFHHFLEFGSNCFLEIAYNVSWQQCLISSRGKTHKKNLGPKFGPNESKSVPKLGFSPFFQVWYISFPFNCIEW